SWAYDDVDVGPLGQGRIILGYHDPVFNNAWNHHPFRCHGAYLHCIGPFMLVVHNTGSCRFRFKPVLMMEPPKERPHGDPQGLGERMSMHLESCRQVHGRLWNAWSQSHVRTASIVMQYPCMQQAPQVALSEWYQHIQALPPERADEPLAERIGLRT